MCRPFAVLFVSAFAGFAAAGDVPDDWAFKPVRKPAIPQVHGQAASPIDAFLLQRLESAGLGYTPTADKATLLRRVTFDLTGLPPTIAELDAFLADHSVTAFAKIVDRLLASPAFGERQALPWLDQARFAETDGFKADDKRPNAWRYRDYVIRSFNADKRFDRFIKEQIAGDELYPTDPDALTATAFLRHYPDEYNAVNLEQRRQEILNDVTDTTGQAFLGITLGCAKCHDHKFDPIKQQDYYRIQAFFAGWKEFEAPLMPAEKRAEFDRTVREWEAKTADVRRKIEEIERPYKERFSQKRRSRFPDELSHLLDIAPEKRTPLEQQLASMVVKQVYADDKGMFTGMKPAEKERWEGLKKQLADAGPRPASPAVAMAFTDVGSDVPPTHILKRGNWRKPGEEVQPGFLSAFDDRLAEIKPPDDGSTSGRRSALAAWIVDAKNPLTARTIVNRVWAHLFGQGIVDSLGDLGFQGDRPAHPELLDWLATRFMEQGWSLKQLYREILLTNAYQQGTTTNATASKVDPENNLLWRMNRRRLGGEAIRDAVLSVAGTFNVKAGGPSVFPELPAELKAPAAWPVSADPVERDRRSVYVYVKRNLRYPLFGAFDAPDRNEACSRRFETTTASQSLMLLNEKLYAEKARQFSSRVLRESGGDFKDAVERAYRIALARKPTSAERDLAERFLNDQSKKAGGRNEALADFCHALLNLNEFVYVD
ncbi:MAG TPA: DUF1549 and DUF1553 domain-containing protein [Gemmataceae bacterium]|jgi:hypothetical protein|nr:DUF1549 and DUF1553 domain-containing protein [Gemmataceae bacterium]